MAEDVIEDKDLAEFVNFFIELEELNSEKNEEINIKTIINPDNTMTTGNMNGIDDLEILVPASSDIIVDSYMRNQVKNHQTVIEWLIAILNPDFFQEDPKMFLGENDTYFKIMKKRALVYVYLSRAILYLFVIYLIFRIFNE